MNMRKDSPKPSDPLPSSKEYLPPFKYEQIRLDLLPINAEHLKCSICLHLYNNPVAMNCGHTFCSNCLSDKRNAVQQCPECRAPLQRMDSFKKNISLSNIIDELTV